MLTEKQFADLLDRPESKTMDFKLQDYDTATPDKKAGFIKDILAMANTLRQESAFIILGVLEKGGRIIDAPGVTSHRNEAHYQQIIHDHVNPLPSFQYFEQCHDEKSFGVFEIHSLPQGPFTATKRLAGETVRVGAIYWRQGSMNAEVTPFNYFQARREWEASIGPILKRAQEIERNDQQNRLHDRLSQVLGFLVEAINGNPFHWSKHAQYCKSLDALLDDLRKIQQSINAKSFRLNAFQEKCVIESAHEVCELIRSLSPVAFQLSGERGVLWLSVSNSITQLSKLYPYQTDSVSTVRRVIIAGQDEFSLAFCELIEHLLAFELAKIS